MEDIIFDRKESYHNYRDLWVSFYPNSEMRIGVSPRTSTYDERECWVCDISFNEPVIVDNPQIDNGVFSILIKSNQYLGSKNTYTTKIEIYNISYEFQIKQLKYLFKKMCLIANGYKPEYFEYDGLPIMIIDVHYLRKRTQKN